ncbi:hypothetical protein [Blattabacterium cuenoti]|uniref:hypothetical protein n=1 Tax=Blattabacterium cuenoti TaxID=1653831 RepID=UPI00163B70EF|nr:hypothetical protein [Blattabacterium cuenoti]
MNKIYKNKIKRKFFNLIIKNGKRIFEYPILSIFYLIEDFNTNEYPNLIGTLIKKKS